MKMQKILMTISAGLIVLFLAGCELTDYSLIFDTSGKSKTIPVNTSGPGSFLDSTTIPLSALKDLADYDIDSVRFFNLTLHVTDDSSDANAEISGQILVEGMTLLTITDVKVSEFSEERSIFDKKLTGYTYNKTAVVFLLNAVRTQSPEEIKVIVSGSSNAKLNFDLTITLYAQLFTSP